MHGYKVHDSRHVCLSARLSGLTASVTVSPINDALRMRLVEFQAAWLTGILTAGAAVRHADAASALHNPGPECIRLCRDAAETASVRGSLDARHRRGGLGTKVTAPPAVKGETGEVIVGYKSGNA